MQLLKIAFYCLLLGCALEYVGCGKWIEDRKLDKQGILTSASIVRRSTWAHYKFMAPTCLLTLNYASKEGQHLSTEIEVTHAYFQSHEDPATSHVTVRYLSDNPTVAVIEGERHFPVSAFVGLFLLILGLASGWLGLRRLPTESSWEPRL